jgi:thiol-disulfide isomerase/thioredoxin
VINVREDRCPGCRVEAPVLKELQQARREIELLGLDHQDMTEDVNWFYEEF